MQPIARIAQPAPSTWMATQQGKAELPTLGGTRIKTRKRDEKVKYDPTSFCEQVIAGLNATGGGLDEISKYLDQGGDQLNYRYAGICCSKS